MLAVLFASLSALSYGASDFSGALASNDNDSSLVTVAMQIVSLVTLLAVIAFYVPEVRTTEDLLWGALGGLGAAYGLTTFYKALALGPIATAASITALTSAAVPVLAGLALGDRPSAITMVGIALAVPAAVLVSAGGTGSHASPLRTTPRERVAALGGGNRTRILAASAGLGFGLFFVALSRTNVESGLYPLIGARLASIAALTLVLTTQKLWAPITRRWWPIVLLAGILDCAANSFYLLALPHGSFTWIAAISSLYPVATVLLARFVLKERLARLQIVGLAMAAAAMVLVTAGAD